MFRIKKKWFWDQFLPKMTHWTDYFVYYWMDGWVMDNGLWMNGYANKSEDIGCPGYGTSCSMYE